MNQSPELYVLGKFIDKGHLIFDINLEFDSKGNIKNNYEINGFVKDAKINLLKDYQLSNLNFIFNLDQKNYSFRDIDLKLNDSSLFSDEINIVKKNDKFEVKGLIENKLLEIKKNKINLYIKNFFPKLDIENIKFISKNSFSFIIDKKIRFKDFKLSSNIELIELVHSIDNNFINVFPEIKDKVYFNNHELVIIYENNKLDISGKGNVLFQKNEDYISYNFNQNDKLYNLDVSLDVINNLLDINFLNYKKEKKINSNINLSVSKKNNISSNINLIVKEKNKEIIKIQNLEHNHSFRITDLDLIKLNFLDTEKVQNSFKIFKKKNQYYLEGKSYNANYLLQSFIDSKKNDKLNIINKDFDIKINIENIFLDKKNVLYNSKGFLTFKNNEIVKANLNGNFENNKKLNLTINSDGKNKITTLFVDKAEPIIKRYKFIKGFEEGFLDFYSHKNKDQTVSTLKIYDFKLKELPLLTKILTLASLQGIADILSGEGIRFNEFEMNFENQKNIMTINEIYAIGPAISVLMSGYVEKDKLISLRGTLVPATTINKVIGSIPVLGKILVGTKTGEGVFGVSFKIKGPPKNLETSVNPIKTLTPRFITRTLEKIKKN